MIAPKCTPSFVTQHLLQSVLLYPCVFRPFVFNISCLFFFSVACIHLEAFLAGPFYIWYTVNMDETFSDR